MLGCGELKSVLMTPVGMLMGMANIYGQMGAEFFTGMQPADGHQLLVGAHVWGLPGLYGGVKVTPCPDASPSPSPDPGPSPSPDWALHF
jgi:hypothetical protein